MKFETVKDLDDEKFRRLTGVKRPTFDKMVGILDESIKNRKVNSGRKKKLNNDSKSYPIATGTDGKGSLYVLT